MSKYKPGDKFILEVTGVDDSGSRTLYETKGLKGLCSENMLDNLEKIETKTNADKIRAMSEEELATAIMCPVDSGLTDMSCSYKGDEYDCIRCCEEWLKEEADE